MPTVPVTGRFDLTDAQREMLGPLLPRGKKPGRPPNWSRRQLATRYEANLHVAAINEWLRPYFLNTP